MLSLLGRLLLLLPGFLLIAAVIWLGGPYVVISGSRPLETEFSRLVAIGCVVGAWLAWVLFERWRARRASGQFAAAVVTQASAEPLPPADVVKLREGFEQAASTLGQRRKGASLYDLPWYVFIGPPGSGKTTALLNSGLHFSVEQGLGQPRLRGVGGTRNCDWWFTDEAVFLDTAGRFTTQDSDAASDSAGWKEFLALLARYRKRRPINGVILTISVKDLLTQTDAERERQVEAARYRLRELGRELQIQLPVYVMVTMCDLVAGFAEYFDDLPVEGRAQVWGVTFPYEQSVSGQAARTLSDEFDALVVRLHERLFVRLEEEADERRRARLFAFPQQVAALRDSLAQYVNEVFTSGKYDRQVLLRGVYLTSGTQEGTPIDRLLGSIGRGFRVAADAVAPMGRGKAYFVERLLTQVLIGESGLAGVNRRLELQKAVAQLGIYAALIIVAVFGVMLLSISYRRNASYLTDIERDAVRLRDIPTPRSALTIQTLLPRLDAVRAVVASAGRYDDNVPWGMTWGLYQGNAIGNAARDAYLLELDSSLLPFLTRRLQQRLVQYGSEPEKLYEYLKAYLMLGQPEHLNKTHLRDLAILEWRPGSGVSEEASASLTRHLATLIADPAALRPVALDPGVVTQACNTVRQASLASIMYGWLKDTYRTDESQVVRLDAAGGVVARQVLRRKSGISLSEPVPSLFTRVAFERVTGGELPSLVAEFAKDNWVCGGRVVEDRGRLQSEVIALYQKDYIKEWDRILGDIAINWPASVSGMADVLAILASPTSPLRGVLQMVVDNTRLYERPQPKAAEEGGVAATGRAYANRFSQMFSKASGAPSSTPASPGAVITGRFQDLHRLFAGESGQTQMDLLQARFRQLEQRLRLLAPEAGGGGSVAALRDPEWATMFQSLQQDSTTLPSPVREFVEEMRAVTKGEILEGSRNELTDDYRRIVAECQRLVAGRFPFTEDSRVEMPMPAFTQVFGPNGLFDRFIEGELKKHIDTSTRPWTWLPGTAQVQGMLPHLEQARAIRDTFFAGGSPQPEVGFSVTITHVDAAALKFALDVDGQKFEDRRGGRAAATWPGQNGGSAAATFDDRTGIRSGPSYEGPWAWFRLIDASQPRRESDTRTSLTFQGRAGHEARVSIESTSDNNPFARREWQGFSCGS